MYRLPPQESKTWTSAPGEPYEGALSRTVGADLDASRGRIQAKKLVINSKQDDFGAGELDNAVVAFGYYNGKYWANDTDDMLVSDTANAGPNDEFIKDTLSNTPGVDSAGDIEIFNGKMYVSETSVLNTLEGATWTASAVTGLSGSPTLLQTYADRLYYTDNNVTVGSINASNVKATTSFTLDLQLSNSSNLQYKIQMLEAGTNQIWIGTDNDGEAVNYVYAWDGQTQNTTTAQYELEAGVIAGIVPHGKNSPIIFDRRGRLMAFNGAGFDELDRIPVNGILTSDAVHHNGMMVNDDGEILINFKSSTVEGNYSPDAPSGIWAWNPRNGFYCKYVYSLHDKDDSGATNLTEYGQLEMNEVGAIFPAYTRTTTGNGSFFASAQYLTTGGTAKAAIWIDDTSDDKQKIAQVCTRWLDASAVEDTFTGIAAKHSKLPNADDRLELKYRLDDYDAVSGTCTYYSRYKLETSATGMSDIKSRFDDGEGHEVTILYGDNAGKPLKVTDIEQQGSNYIITVDEELTNASGSTRFVIENWNEVNTQDETQFRHTKGTVGEKGTKIQVKVNMKVTGKGELEEIMANNTPSVDMV